MHEASLSYNEVQSNSEMAYNVFLSCVKNKFLNIVKVKCKISITTDEVKFTKED